MALTLARPVGNGPGGGGLAMFYVETHDAPALNGMRVERLKDKLGTRKVPTAELLLDGARAELVSDTRNGTRNIEMHGRDARLEQRHLGRLHAPRAGIGTLVCRAAARSVRCSTSCRCT